MPLCNHCGQRGLAHPLPTVHFKISAPPLNSQSLSYALSHVHSWAVFTRFCVNGIDSTLRVILVRRGGGHGSQRLHFRDRVKGFPLLSRDASSGHESSRWDRPRNPQVAMRRATWVPNRRSVKHSPISLEEASENATRSSRFCIALEKAMHTTDHVAWSSHLPGSNSCQTAGATQAS